MEVESRSVIDKPGFSVPHEHVRVARCAVNVRYVSVEQHDPRGQVTIQFLSDRIERHGTRKVVEREVEAGARSYQILYLRIRLGAGEVAIEFDEDKLGYREFGGSGKLARDEFSYQGLGPLARTPKLEYIHPIVIGFYYGWK